MKSKHGFITTPERSSLMKKIKSTNTKPELLFRRELWSMGYRYHIKSTLPGKPDLVFKGRKIVIFIDGDFWHGYNWEEKKPKLVANREYWIKKIEGNIKRDTANNEKLTNLGFTVLRFWEHEVLKGLQTCLFKVTTYLTK